jgi:hypothetical protein
MIRLTLLLALVAFAAAPAAAQGHGHGPKKAFIVEPSHAMSVTRDVLGHQGFEIVRVEQTGNDQIVVYRRGNMGRGKGKGPQMRMIVRKMGTHVVFVDTPDAILVEINARLKL